MRRSLLSERESFALREALLVTDREPNCAARFVVDKCTIVGRQVRYRALFAFVSITLVRTDLIFGDLGLCTVLLHCKAQRMLNIR